MSKPDTTAPCAVPPDSLPPGISRHPLSISLKETCWDPTPADWEQHHSKHVPHPGTWP